MLQVRLRPPQKAAEPLWNAVSALANLSRVREQSHSSYARLVDPREVAASSYRTWYSSPSAPLLSPLPSDEIDSIASLLRASSPRYLAQLRLQSGTSSGLQRTLPQTLYRTLQLPRQRASLSDQRPPGLRSTLFAADRVSNQVEQSSSSL